MGLSPCTFTQPTPGALGALGTLGAPVLSIAGSDPSGGAGLQADLKAISACGGYGMSVVTALTAQNTRGVQAVHVPPVEFLRAQLEAVLSDVPPAAIKIGMLGAAAVIAEVTEVLASLHARAQRPPVVLDPVMVATSGDRLLDADAERALAALMAHVDLVTPNAPELAALLSREAATCTADLVTQARALAHEHRVWVLAKAGHLVPEAAQETHDAAALTDVLVSPTGDVATFGHAYVPTENTHGTGCTLSSAIATFAARAQDAAPDELDWAAVVGAGLRHLTRALGAADRLSIGAGHGPVHHFVDLWEGHGAPGAGLGTATWRRLALRAEAAYSTSVVRALASGHPPADLLQHYLGQDLAYLEDYSSRMEQAAALAQGRGLVQQSEFWGEAAAACREEEPQLHAALGASVPEPDPVTSA